MMLPSTTNERPREDARKGFKRDCPKDPANPGHIPEASPRQQHRCDDVSRERDQARGRIERFDNFTVLLVRGNSSQVVYKHAISTIHPAEPVELLSPSADANG